MMTIAPRLLRRAIGTLSLVAVVANCMFLAGTAVAGLPSPNSKNFSYTDYLTVSTTKVAVTLHRGHPNYALMRQDLSGYTTGLLYGPGFTIHNKIAAAWEIHYTTGTQGVGFYESSGGVPGYTDVKIHAYINPVKPNGTYTGTIVLRYLAGKWGWLNGPRIHYAITLTNG